MSNKEDQVYVVKRNGEKELFDVDKINKVVTWACDGINGVSVSDVEINAKIQVSNNILSVDIHNLLIKSAADLISLQTPNYQVVASRLLNYQLRKSVWGGKNPPKLIDLIKKNIDNKVYDSDILNMFSDSEINKLDEYIQHDRDFDFNYCGIKQLCDKYLVKNRKTNEIYETPQFAYMLIAMISFHTYENGEKLNFIKKAYDYFSKHKISLPTPTMAGVRTPIRQYSSCLLMKVGDSMNSLFSSLTAVGYATARRYGIGIDFGDIRAIGSEIRGGDVIHTGVIPFLKVFESTVKSCHQNGIRGGGATVTFPIFHYEIEDILQLKNNAGTDSNRVRSLDYSIGFSKLFYSRWLKQESITLFSPHEVPDLFKAHGTKEFEDLYLKYEKDSSLKFKKIVSMQELMAIFVKESVETGRYYVINVDNVNENSPWKETVQMSNLCQEVLHPVKPLSHIDDPDAEIGICVLSAINLLEIQSDNELEKVCDITVRMLNNLIDYQDYFVEAAKKFTINKRSLGVGVTNLAALLAKNNLNYEDKESPNFVDSWMEKIQYFLLKSSNQLAKEVGPCNHFDQSTYSEGILPIDRYKKTVDEVVTRKLSMDWEGLRENIKKYGLRNCTVTCQMPVESTSVIQSTTNGIEPIKNFLIFKGSKSNVVPVIAPHYSSWKNKYTLAYNMENNIGLINIQAAMQKHFDMSISSNFYYNYFKFENNKLPDSVVIKEMMYAYKMGEKTRYYINTNDGDNQEVDKEEESLGCEGGACTL